MPRCPYEDRSRSGIIAALDPIIEKVRLESLKGKPVLGICNGAQILVESGLVPGLKDKQIEELKKRIEDLEKKIQPQYNRIGI